MAVLHQNSRTFRCSRLPLIGNCLPARFSDAIWSCERIEDGRKLVPVFVIRLNKGLYISFKFDLLARRQLKEEIMNGLIEHAVFYFAHPKRLGLRIFDDPTEFDIFLKNVKLKSEVKSTAFRENLTNSLPFPLLRILRS